MTESLHLRHFVESASTETGVWSVRAGQPDTLAGYKKYSIRLATGIYPIIRPEAGGLVEGLVIQITPAELALIDHYEGDAYQRKKVTLVSGRWAWVYQE